MHNLDWSQVTWLEHLSAFLTLVGCVAFACFIPLALIAAWIALREGDL
ncbi:hypothetical protein [Xanthomonas axonopodis]